ncbi:MAG: hypothetical protein M1825_000636 [Sarcosagium campestre]|nr:MAG: hypothetical protein M1825_000636 [Sarcosagium campestre]
MSTQRYERISGNDDATSPVTAPSRTTDVTPVSPPPSFRSRASSPISHVLSHDPLASDADRALAESFDNSDGGDSEDDENGDDRQRLMRDRTRPSANSVSDGLESGRTAEDGPRPRRVERRVTELPVFMPPAATPSSGRGGPTITNDGVFANMNAKPERGEKTEEHPPSYEQAAADAAPPYWETTILAPGVGSDEVFIDGLPVGSFFSFVWNGMISMSFQLVGFLLTYLLHTTHAAKNGSKAGLGITLVQYGFYMKGTGSKAPPVLAEPTDPNNHDFDPSTESDKVAAAMSGADGASAGSIASITSSDWLAYVLMIVGWFILIGSVGNYVKARRHEQLVLQSPDRGLNVPIVAVGEQAETVV